MAAEMRFCLLGPMTVRCDGRAVPIGGGKQRAVLALLLLNAGRVVSIDELTEALWADEPPRSARVTVQNYVKRLRNELSQAGGGAWGHDRIVTRSPGYLIELAAGELDVAGFEAGLESARAAARAGAWAVAAEQAAGALALWRGQPLADVQSELLAEREAPRLAELGLRAAETGFEARLQLGQHAEVTAELERLASAHPLREHLQALLMIALYRDGRQAEALLVYRRTRRALIEQVGSEPGTELRDLHQRVLNADPGLGPVAPVAAAAPAVPRQLPAPVRHFVGRDGELAALTSLIEEPGTVVISAIGGAAGVGKTALAVQWAHRVAGRFPDGQLYVNLRGYDAADPMPATDALAGFLRALGLPGAEIPTNTDERAAAYRSLVASKRMLVLLDNARLVDQVRPLLPASPSCAVVVTSRDRLAGLVARDGAERVELDLLSPGEAVGLLRELIGRRVSAEPAAAMMLAEQCCRLPLALRVAAELAASRPDDSLAGLVSDLADLRRRLDLLVAEGDARTAVRAVFSWSYRHLDQVAARAFGLAGLHPGADFDGYAMAALTGSSHEEAIRVLGQLTRAHLINGPQDGRYSMHDLLRAYAREQAEQDPLPVLFGYYLYTAALAVDTLFPGEADRRPRIAAPAASLPVPPVAGEADAQAWLDAELANLVVVAERAAACGLSDHVTGLSATLFRYLDAGGHYPEAITIHGRAIEAASEAGDHTAGAHALISLGAVRLQQGRHEQGAAHFREALALCQRTGDRFGQTRALINLGIIDLYGGDNDGAAESFGEVVRLSREAGLRPQEIRGLTGLGSVALFSGRYRQAAGQLAQAVELCQLTGDRTFLVEALCALGDASQRLGRYDQARTYLAQAREVSRETGDKVGDIHAVVFCGITELGVGRLLDAERLLTDGLAVSREHGHHPAEAHALCYLGKTEIELGRVQLAASHLAESLALFRQIGDRSGEAVALNGLAEISLATGRPGQARAEFAAALALADRIKAPDQQARAHDGLGAAYFGLKDLFSARKHWRAAVELYTELESAQAGQVRERLLVMGPPDRPDSLNPPDPPGRPRRLAAGRASWLPAAGRGSAGCGKSPEAR